MIKGEGIEICVRTETFTLRLCFNLCFKRSSEDSPLLCHGLHKVRFLDGCGWARRGSLQNYFLLPLVDSLLDPTVLQSIL